MANHSRVYFLKSNCIYDSSHAHSLQFKKSIKIYIFIGIGLEYFALFSLLNLCCQPPRWPHPPQVYHCSYATVYICLLCLIIYLNIMINKEYTFFSASVITMKKYWPGQVPFQHYSILNFLYDIDHQLPVYCIIWGLLPPQSIPSCFLNVPCWVRYMVPYPKVKLSVFVCANRLHRAVEIPEPAIAILVISSIKLLHEHFMLLFISI